MVVAESFARRACEIILSNSGQPPSGGPSSQSEGKEDRARRRANKIRERLGGEPERAAPFPQKPPSMRQSTYERLRNKAFDDETTANEMQIERLLAWLNKSGNKREFW
jgi:hypothetical protein